MSEIAIEAEGLGKRYRIGALVSYGTLRETLVGVATVPFRKLRQAVSGIDDGDGSPRPRQEIWALRDVSFTLRQGEVLGIIGRNGAGKSTLLKVLSRITKPTEGRARVRGRIGSLLEVGTGFHPELSGRENIYLSGAILGMRKAEIRRKFDEIVAFAGVEKFLDTPVKRYSSGMYVRLAFAVAAHLETEILLVDEVLAVGDAEFQARCVGKIGHVAREGRTVLFVSHNMGSIRTLCERVVLLEGGHPIADGGAQQVTSQYLTRFFDVGTEVNWGEGEAPGGEEVRLTAVRVTAEDPVARGVFSSRRPIFVEMDFVAATAHPALRVGFDLQTHDGITVFRSFQTDGGPDRTPVLRQGENRWRCTIPPGLLNGGDFYVCPRIGLQNLYWILQSDPAAQFRVAPDHGDPAFWSALGGARPGVVAPGLEWSQSEGIRS